MSALTQYITLAEEHRSLLESACPEPLNALRNEADRKISDMQLPAKGSENYETIDLDSLLSPDFGLNLARVNIDVNPAASFRCNVPDISSHLFLLINDSFALSRKAAETPLPAGVIACSLNEAARRYPELVEKYLGKAADMGNPLVALDSLLFQDGFFLYVPDGVKLAEPLQIVNILNNGTPLMVARRSLIVIGHDAEATLLSCDHTQNPDTDFLNLHTTEVFAAENSKLRLYELEESSMRTTRLSSLYLRQKAESDVVIDNMALFNGTTRNEYYCSLDGNHASLRLLGMGIEDADRQLDSYSHISHNAGDCHTDELFKYVVDDCAHAAFVGRIYVAPGATKTEAYQSNRNILGSDNSRVFAKPQLEIYNDDVKCSHGTAIGRLDPMQIFYMRSRGIPEATARLLLKQAFLMDIVDAVDVPALRDRLHSLVQARFEGRQSACSDCSACMHG